MSEKNRFQDNSSGVITDTKYNKYWLPKDSWGDLGQWRNFNEAKSYTQLMNQVYAGGFSDWRLPTLEEAKSLYDQALGQRDWDDEAVFIDALFVTKCANFMWINETNDKQALRTHQDARRYAAQPHYPVADVPVQRLGRQRHRLAYDASGGICAIGSGTGYYRSRRRRAARPHYTGLRWPVFR